MIPLARIDWASSARRSFWKTRRGWRGLGSMRSMEIERSAASPGTSASGLGGRVGRRALRPLPRALRGLSGLFMMIEDLFGESDVAFGPTGPGVIDQEDR